MRDGDGVVEPGLVGARALREWITGERDEYARVFLVESGAMAHRVAEVAGRDDVVLLPEEGGLYAGAAGVVPYGGALRDIEDELFFGERGVELQDYVAAAFVQIIGPTAVSLFDASSGEAFLDDAELARRTGVFPSALIDPRVLLADRSALSRPAELAAPNAIRVSPDGAVSIGVQGDTVGTIDELPALLTEPRPRAAALGATAPRDAFISDLTRREWIARYLQATDLMKMLRLANGAAKISGFGWVLVDDDLADAEPLTADPFLLETTDGFVLADIRTLRRQLLSPVAAQVVAVTQTSRTPEVAAERVARQLGVSASEARTLCLEAVSALDIHFGRRAEVSCRANGVER